MHDSETETGTSAPGAVPTRLRDVPETLILDVDVRQDLRDGREPFSRIMEARQRMPDDGILRLRAIFEPVPLYRVMAGQGLEHWTEQLAPDDWRIWFFDPDRLRSGPDSPAKEGGGEAHSGVEAPERDEPAAGEGPSSDVVVLDVRGLEPPEPLVRTLEALENLPDGATLLHINVREPAFLFPRLEERGATWEVREQEEEGVVRVFIRNGGF